MTYTEDPPPLCILCCLALSPPCGLLCVNHDSFCETVTLVSEVHRESTLALSLAKEFSSLVDCPTVIVLCVLTERICIHYSLSSFSLYAIKLTSEKLIFVCVCVQYMCMERKQNGIMLSKQPVLASANIIYTVNTFFVSVKVVWNEWYRHRASSEMHHCSSLLNQVFCLWHKSGFLRPCCIA